MTAPQSAGTPEKAPDGTPDDVPPVVVTDVSLAYGDVPVLEGVSLSVERGEFVGLVGPNGAGKTTLLRTINGALSPDSGSVAVAGADVHELPSRAASRRVATVPQTASVAFDFPVEDLVEMGRTPYYGRFSGDPDAADAVERALERTDTARLRDRRVDSLSGGERRRVLLARALAQETPVLLLDEPTASLDINHQVRTLELVRGLVDDEGTTALAAIHDLDLAARFCDRIALLADGEVLSVGPPSNVLRDDPLADAFGTDTAVLPNPVTGTPTVTAVSSNGSRPETCHVLGAGHAAAGAVAALARSGFTVTAGILPADGVAAATADELAAETVTAPPFSPPPPAAEAAVRDCLDRADAVVIAGPVPPGLRDAVAAHDTVTVETADTRDIGASVERFLDGATGAATGTGASSAEDATDAGPDDIGDSDDEPDADPRPLVERVRRAVERRPTD